MESWLADEVFDLAYEKAKVLSDAVVNNQREDGLSPTGWFGNYDEYHNWINCHIAAIQALQEFCTVAGPRW